jgi:hypothetical protein
MYRASEQLVAIMKTRSARINYVLVIKSYRPLAVDVSFFFCIRHRITMFVFENRH